MTAFRKRRYQCTGCLRTIWLAKLPDQDGLVTARCSVCGRNMPHQPYSTSNRLPNQKENPSWLK